jgi:hypothetical protein
VLLPYSLPSSESNCITPASDAIHQPRARCGELP